MFRVLYTKYTLVLSKKNISYSLSMLFVGNHTSLSVPGNSSLSHSQIQFPFRVSGGENFNRNVHFAPTVQEKAVECLWSFPRVRVPLFSAHTTPVSVRFHTFCSSRTWVEALLTHVLGYVNGHWIHWVRNYLLITAQWDSPTKQNIPCIGPKGEITDVPESRFLPGLCGRGRERPSSCSFSSFPCSCLCLGQ